MNASGKGIFQEWYGVGTTDMGAASPLSATWLNIIGSSKTLQAQIKRKPDIQTTPVAAQGNMGKGLMGWYKKNQQLIMYVAGGFVLVMYVLPMFGIRLLGKGRKRGNLSSLAKARRAKARKRK